MLLCFYSHSSSEIFLWLKTKKQEINHTCRGDAGSWLLAICVMPWEYGSHGQTWQRRLQTDINLPWRTHDLSKHTHSYILLEHYLTPTLARTALRSCEASIYGIIGVSQPRRSRVMSCSRPSKSKTESCPVDVPRGTRKAETTQRAVATLLPLTCSFS